MCKKAKFGKTIESANQHFESVDWQLKSANQHFNSADQYKF